MIKNYTHSEIKKSLRKLGITKNDIIYVSGNLVSFGKPKNIKVKFAKIFFNRNL